MPKEFVTFESDGGAFNNKRVGFESVVVFAIVFQRTLVIPPQLEYAFGDYFDLPALSKVCAMHFS